MSALEIHAKEHTEWCLSLDESGDFDCNCASQEAVAELAALRTDLAEAREMLRLVGDTIVICPACHMVVTSDDCHKPDCRLNALLQKSAMSALDTIMHRLTYVPELMREKGVMRTAATNDADDKLFSDAIAELRALRSGRTEAREMLRKGINSVRTCWECGGKQYFDGKPIHHAPDCKLKVTLDGGSNDKGSSVPEEDQKTTLPSVRGDSQTGGSA